MITEYINTWLSHIGYVIADYLSAIFNKDHGIDKIIGLEDGNRL